MERLTTNLVRQKDGGWKIEHKIAVEDIQLVIDRLTAYEDTGLTPEEIMLMKESWRAACKEYVINRIPGNGGRNDETTHQ